MFRRFLIFLGIIKEQKPKIEPVQKIEPALELPSLKEQEVELAKKFREKSQLHVAYLVAKTQLGVKEISGGSHNKKIVEYHQSCTLQANDDETSWCSSFVNWCYIVSGFILNPGLMHKILTNAKYDKSDIELFRKSALEFCENQFWAGIESVKTLESTGVRVKLPTRSAMARSWLGFGKITKTPKRGECIAVFERGNNGYSGHVGFYEGQGISFIDTLGGNQSNAVNVSEYSKLKLLGYVEEA